jgi:hypothetical protein
MLQIPDYINSTKNYAIKKIEVVGSEIDALKYPIKTPVANETSHPDIKVIDGWACPACLNMMHNLTSKLVGLRGEQINLVIGSNVTEKMFDGKDRLIALGDCAIRKLEELNINSIEKISEKIDDVEQFVLLRKLLITEGKPTITHIDKVKSKMKKLLSKVIG